jgi:hypothetical protein
MLDCLSRILAECRVGSVAEFLLNTGWRILFDAAFRAPRARGGDLFTKLAGKPVILC